MGITLSLVQMDDVNVLPHTDSHFWHTQACCYHNMYISLNVWLFRNVNIEGHGSCSVAAAVGLLLELPHQIHDLMEMMCYRLDVH